MENSGAEKQRSGFHSQFGSLVGRIVSLISLTVRRKMYGEFVQHFDHPKSVLDVGVTSESVAPEANFFEELFPYKDRITAVGVEDAFHLEERYPGLRFVKVKAGEPLPFRHGQFEVVFSNAVLEHIVEDSERLFFLRELLRVGKKVFLTTPHKYFPVEHHTGIPLIHFLFPNMFYYLLKLKGPKGFYNRQNLRPLGASEIRKLMRDLGCPFQLVPVRFCGIISNWVLILESNR